MNSGQASIKTEADGEPVRGRTDTPHRASFLEPVVFCGCLPMAGQSSDRLTRCYKCQTLTLLQSGALFLPQYPRISIPYLCSHHASRTFTRRNAL
ncbi:MAG: hypothetical protein RLZZ458_989 [Planctomycetota bacterium]